MARKTYLEEIQSDILDRLAIQPYTIQDMAELLNLPYTTVQQAHKALRADDKIVKFDRRDRGARWTLGPNNGPKDIIPVVSLNGEHYKLTQFVGSQNLMSAASTSAETIMRVWATIAMTAQRLNDGVPDAVLVKRLNAQKAELSNARAVLENLAFFVNQIIDNPKLWDINYLTRFVDDRDWEDFAQHLPAFYGTFYGVKDEA